MSEPKTYSLPYVFETRPDLGEDMFMVGIYSMHGGKETRHVYSPEGIRGLDAIVASIREEMRSARVAAAASAHDTGHPHYGGMR